MRRSRNYCGSESVNPQFTSLQFYTASTDLVLVSDSWSRVQDRSPCVEMYPWRCPYLFTETLCPVADVTRCLRLPFFYYLDGGYCLRRL